MTIKERYQAAKEHVNKKKGFYIYAVGGVLVGAAGALILTQGGSSAEIIQKVNQIGFRNEANPTIINLVERSTPSKPVHLVGTNLYFDSLGDAARKTGHQLSMISRNAKGIIPDVKGDVFEFLEAA